MKATFLFFIASLSFFNISAQSKSGLKKFENRNKDILSLNAIVADKAYYSQAILEYQIIKRILDKHSIIDLDSTTMGGKKSYYKEVSVLKNLEPLQSDTLGLRPCKFTLPEKLEDLKSGFQFRHYLFRGENNTALQAFGIINNNFSKNDLFVVVDYIQYQDCGCDDLPKIRYAVGIRSEFKISDMNLNKNNEPNTSNLNIEKLAASVEFDKLKVDISMKTIGITGKPARLNIPTNTSFNVQTYGEYVKVIDFIRNSLDVSNDSISRKIYIQPEVIPVMDEYRTSISDINTASFDEILQIHKRYKKYEKKISKLKKDDLTQSIDLILKKSLLEEIEVKNDKREQLTRIDKYLKNLDRYERILHFITPVEKKERDVVIVEDENVKQKYNDIKRDYNDAINLISENKIEEAVEKLKKIRQVRHDYGNTYEILNLLSNETDNNKIRAKIVKEYSWLIDKDVLKKLKQ